MFDELPFLWDSFEMFKAWEIGILFLFKEFSSAIDRDCLLLMLH
jgi:hypothetical protein